MFYSRRSIFVKSGVFLLLFLFFASIAFAEGGDKSSSPGIPGQKPLSFASISLVEGGQVRDAADVPTEPKFKLEFDKNVVNSTIWEINRNCFSLVSQNNENVPVSVTKVDDTIDFSQRNYIFVQPVSPLSPGTSYTLIISPALKAKNGVSTLGGTTSGQGLSISFKTQGEAIGQPAIQTTAQQPAQPASPGEQNTAQTNSENAPPQAGGGSDASNSGSKGNANTTGNTSSQDNKSPGAAAGQQQVAVSGESAGQNAASAQPGKTDSPAQTEAGFNYTSLLTILTVVLLAGWIAVELFIKKKKRG